MKRLLLSRPAINWDFTGRSFGFGWKYQRHAINAQYFTLWIGIVTIIWADR